MILKKLIKFNLKNTMNYNNRDSISIATTIEDKFNAVVVALNYAAYKYEIVKIEYSTGIDNSDYNLNQNLDQELINYRDNYLKHLKEFEDSREKLIKYQDFLLYKNTNPRSKKSLVSNYYK